ncbi:putative family 17 glucosidase SCW10 [Smittium mucronatum]|uniref:glucan endo-1,3-beta-D-glucosidase n=1 Tax=Smittium mucronatum TaxID=133383 RepID=A0A1R0GWG7_9FUNG|nr:putative family 17 glucosidase SCW10 [Smittium mucronatum]
MPNKCKNIVTSTTSSVQYSTTILSHRISKTVTVRKCKARKTDESVPPSPTNTENNEGYVLYSTTTPSHRVSETVSFKKCKVKKTVGSVPSISTNTKSNFGSIQYSTNTPSYRVSETVSFKKCKVKKTVRSVPSISSNTRNNFSSIQYNTNANSNRFSKTASVKKCKTRKLTVSASTSSSKPQNDGSSDHSPSRTMDTTYLSSAIEPTAIQIGVYSSQKYPSYPEINYNSIISDDGFNLATHDNDLNPIEYKKRVVENLATPSQKRNNMAILKRSKNKKRSMSKGNYDSLNYNSKINSYGKNTNSHTPANSNKRKRSMGPKNMSADDIKFSELKIKEQRKAMLSKRDVKKVGNPVIPNSPKFSNYKDFQKDSSYHSASYGRFNQNLKERQNEENNRVTSNGSNSPSQTSSESGSTDTESMITPVATFDGQDIIEKSNVEQLNSNTQETSTYNTQAEQSSQNPDIQGQASLGFTNSSPTLEQSTQQEQSQKMDSTLDQTAANSNAPMISENEIVTGTSTPIQSTTQGSTTPTNQPSNSNSKGGSLGSQPASEGSVFWGLTYSPYNTDGSCPNYNKVESDMITLSSVTTRIRLYSTDCDQLLNVVKAISQKSLNIDVYAGIWISNGDERMNNEIDTLISVMKTYGSDRIKGISIGNEEIFKGTMSDTDLVKKLQAARSKINSAGFTNIPIYLTDTDANYSKKMADASDLLQLNIYTIFDSNFTSMDDSVNSVFDRVANAKARLGSNKPVRIGETGYASSGSAGVQSGSQESQIEYAKKLRCKSSENGLEYFFFEAKDALWKSGESQLEQSFGVYNSNYEKKFDFSTLLTC